MSLQGDRDAFVRALDELVGNCSLRARDSLVRDLDELIEAAEALGAGRKIDFEREVEETQDRHYAAGVEDVKDAINETLERLQLRREDATEIVAAIDKVARGVN